MTKLYDWQEHEEKMDFEKKETNIKNMQILSKVFVFYDKKTEGTKRRKKQIKRERKEIKKEIVKEREEKRKKERKKWRKKQIKKEMKKRINFRNITSKYWLRAAKTKIFIVKF